MSYGNNAMNTIHWEQSCTIPKLFVKEHEAHLSGSGYAFKRMYEILEMIEDRLQDMT